MLSRLQELKKEEETLLKIKAMLQDQLNRLKVPLLLDNKAEINQTKLHLGTVVEHDMEEEEEEEDEEEEEGEDEDEFEMMEEEEEDDY
ncbi:hypothetical protein JZ751_019654 [Albula glossodonta]|uniref:snRNA-activating protein complex subunit 5 n=1 Tax=Albula glossodonta TaxID=121402 RepID=A0A8T2NMG5_9TELE|nr:hypothetical protein JZ751_019654 [Albula glossodonta]